MHSVGPDRSAFALVSDALSIFDFHLIEVSNEIIERRYSEREVHIHVVLHCLGSAGNHVKLIVSTNPEPHMPAVLKRFRDPFKPQYFFIEVGALLQIPNVHRRVIERRRVASRPGLGQAQGSTNGKETGQHNGELDRLHLRNVTAQFTVITSGPSNSFFVGMVPLVRTICILFGRLPKWHSSDYSINQPRHLIFDQRRIVWVWFRAPRSRKSQALIELDSAFVVAHHHQSQITHLVLPTPLQNLVYQ